LIKRLEQVEESVVDEYNSWHETKIYQDTLESARGKTIQTANGIKTILTVEPKDGKLNVFFKEGSFAIILDISTLKQITNQKNNEETK
jgi:hypothetical protein